MRTPVILAAVLIVAACKGQTQTQTKGEQYRIAIEANVKARLPDPESAVFSNAVLSLKAGVPALCGTVTSANGAGGSAVPQRFIGGGTVVLESDLTPTEFAETWAQLC